MNLATWNALPGDRAAKSLGAVCAVPRWIDILVAARPFRSLQELRRAADDAWAMLDPNDWRQALAHHPRIGERMEGTKASPAAIRLSAAEQSGVAAADRSIREALEQANRDYEARFGHIFLTCATGKSAEAMLAEARARMTNDPARELLVAAEEQRKIIQLRLQQVFVATEVTSE